MTTTLSPGTSVPAMPDAHANLPASNAVGGSGAVLNSCAALLLGTTIMFSGTIGGTATTAPVRAPEVRYNGGWTGTGRTFDGAAHVPSALPVEVPAVMTVVPVHHDSHPLLLSDQQAVQWLHDQSGLTWDQLSRVFGVSRRAVHMWATGGRMNSSHAATLRELEAVVQGLPGTNSAERRAALLAPGPEGVSIIDRFRARHTPTEGDALGTAYSPDQLLGAQHEDVARSV